VFWKHSRREQRRQKVLDELMGLDPSERQERLNRAVALGDVQAGEVESTLRLIERLDALRVFTIRPYQEEVEPQPVPAEETSPGLEIRAVAAEEQTPPPPVRAASPRRRAKSAARSSTESAPTQAKRWLAAAAMPMDAIESASRLVARDRATRKAVAAAVAPRSRRVKTTHAEHPEPVAVPVVVQRASVPVMAESEAEPSREESWPSIAWLRP
jgi:hypothetical protein